MKIALWSSCKKPDVELFMGEALSQINDLIHSGTTIFIGAQEFHIVLRIQCFIAEMPAKSLLLKFINFNGRDACCHCHSPGKMIHFCSSLYPSRHEDIVRTGKLAEAQNRTINGIKGLSLLLAIIRFPDYAIYDYMRLICTNHLQAPIKRWKTLLSDSALRSIGKDLGRQHVPHNMHVMFSVDMKNSHDWKAKHG